MRKIIFVFIVLLFGFIGGDGDKFNEIPLTVIEQNQYPTCKIFEDSTKHQYVELKLAVVPQGYVPEKGSVLEGQELIDISGISKECFDFIIATRNYDRAKNKFKQTQ